MKVSPEWRWQCCDHHYIYCFSLTGIFISLIITIFTASLSLVSLSGALSRYGHNDLLLLSHWYLHQGRCHVMGTAVLCTV
jgi:hypothetical protein